MKPPLRYAKTVDGGNVAFTVAGDGYPYVDISGEWGANIALEWESPGVGGLWQALADRFMFVRIEPRGGPNSDWPPVGRKYRDYVLDDIDAVLNRLEIKTCAMTARGYCAQHLAEYAVTRAEVVSHLLFVRPLIQPPESFDWNQANRLDEVRARFAGLDVATFRAHAGLPIGASRAQIEIEAQTIRSIETAKGEALWARLYERNLECDLSPFLPLIEKRTVVAAGPGHEDAAKTIASAINRSLYIFNQVDAGFLPDPDGHEFTADRIAQFVYGRDYRPQVASSRAAADPTFLSNLTARELEVLTLVAAGHSDAEIAESLVLSRGTIHRHVANIYAKLGIHNRAQATAAYFGVASDGAT